MKQNDAKLSVEFNHEECLTSAVSEADFERYLIQTISNPIKINVKKNAKITNFMFNDEIPWKKR